MRIRLSKIGEPQTRRQANIAKRINLIALSLLFLLLGLLFYAFWQLRESKQELERQGRILEEQTRRLELVATELSIFRERERRVAQDQEYTLEEVREEVKKGNLEGIREILGAEQKVGQETSASPGQASRKPDVSVFISKGNQKFEQAMGEVTEKKGYQIAFHSKKGNEYSWVQKSPAILYFERQHREDALILEKIYETITGLDFEVKQGERNPMPEKGPGQRIEVHLFEGG